MAGRVLLKIAYVLTCRILGLVVLLCRGDRVKDAELLVLRHENAVLRRQSSRLRYEPADRVWFTALARLIPRRRWADVFPLTPATLLAWHRRLAAKKYDWDAWPSDSDPWDDYDYYHDKEEDEEEDSD